MPLPSIVTPIDFLSWLLTFFSYELRGKLWHYTRWHQAIWLSWYKNASLGRGIVCRRLIYASRGTVVPRYARVLVGCRTPTYNIEIDFMRWNTNAWNWCIKRKNHRNTSSQKYLLNLVPLVKEFVAKDTPLAWLKSNPWEQHIPSKVHITSCRAVC